MILYVLALAAAQLPAAPPLPPPGQAEQAVMAPIDAAFRALETQDSAALLRVVYPDGRVTAVGTLASGFTGVRAERWSDFAARMKPGNGFRERITNPAIEVDGDFALVWAPFTIEEGGKIRACGVDHFDLVREQGEWKIMNLTFSSRVTGCSR